MNATNASLGVAAASLGIAACYLYTRKASLFSRSDYGSERQQAEWAVRMATVQQSGSQRGASAQLVPLASRTHKSAFDLQIVSRLMVGKYANIWRGHVLLKDAVALHLYGMLMQRQMPKTIFDLGTAGGGSAVWFATQMKAMGLVECKVITVDIEDLRTPACRREMEQLGIEFLQADLRDASAMLSAIKDKAHPWLIAEDCHVDAHVIMAAFDPATTSGDYIIFEDTHPCHPDKSWMDAEDMDKYTYGAFANKKLAAVEAAMGALSARYSIDASIQDLYGHNGATFINGVFARL
ncbi:hypothetical protein EMIHUDRAFT_210197 [Emiliania huxleyi CCMP1516]|uniref:Rhamnosyl O-methyltransferase n=2 Tax=Emiliania huxleyi TaxID=2903 RepID=A0A0D3J1S6_EMIH1|nr:hypothetical protein EMIHUDRAFT_210197 [Emiliania huxleyi CCMP1516]EOD17461.1 hypothetical protein EMIHUDRAFT_210197 [Emiliania huxleyi CCMP1516]|eukprot:XP_005769890.1 hypothetical protein EMIHUDRAFT_210197 [Emiliania huxleyi CCMP1516]